ncbi:hypothetical protein EUGRSUZ_D01402 [Eucalyptus grandis]|uniref:Uncharacterized protein n=2 Tax=Eucalyptus grandis TaxID=71139 RepID=A0ACC3L4H5_EUCGR|nr:hypothetical protein EUGRSUZ_D01402 [Eucalyptus grandis]
MSSYPSSQTFQQLPLSLQNLGLDDFHLIESLSKPGEILSHLELSRSPVHAYKLRWAFTSTSRGVACAKL